MERLMLATKFIRHWAGLGISRSGNGFATFSTRSKIQHRVIAQSWVKVERGSSVGVRVLHAEHIDVLYPTGTMHTAVFAAYAEAERG